MTFSTEEWQESWKERRDSRETQILREIETPGGKVTLLPGHLLLPFFLPQTTPHLCSVFYKRWTLLCLLSLFLNDFVYPHDFTLVRMLRAPELMASPYASPLSYTCVSQVFQT